MSNRLSPFLIFLLFVLSVCRLVQTQCGCDDCCGCCGTDSLAIGDPTAQLPTALAAQNLLNAAQGVPRIVSLSNGRRRRKRKTDKNQTKFQFGRDPTPYLMGWPMPPGKDWARTAPKPRLTPEQEWYKRMEEETRKKSGTGGGSGRGMMMTKKEEEEG